MFSSGRQNGKAGRVRGTRRPPKVYSIPAWPKHHDFAGEFEVTGQAYKLVFAPSHAEVDGGKLRLTGLLTITDPKGHDHTQRDFPIVLASTQGGIGQLPGYRHIFAGASAVADDAAMHEHHSGAKTEADSKVDAEPKGKSELPVTDSTGALSFCGVMYFHMAPLSGARMGVSADLEHVQLNVRLYATDDFEREIQYVYSKIVSSLYLTPPEHGTAAAETRDMIDELNRAFSMA